METIGSWELWSIFGVILVAMLSIDLFFTKGGKQHTVSLKEAALWSMIWVLIAILFSGGLWLYLDDTLGRVAANEQTTAFLTGYLVEKALAIDNVFVWMMIFSFFSIPTDLQRRVLLFGIVGAIVLRTAMIFAGSWLISEFHWLLYIFGAFLVATGVKMAWFADHNADLSQNPLLRWVKNHYPVTEDLHGEKFFVLQKGVRTATPLAFALLFVEFSDVIFAVDSIPAIFAITTDPFIVLTSNLFAILGLRAMYFLLADLGNRFSLLKYGLAAILVFIGFKMLLVEWIKIPVFLSLGIVAALLFFSIFASLIKASREEKTGT